RNALGFGGVVTAGESTLCIDMAITPLEHGPGDRYFEKIVLKKKVVRKPVVDSPFAPVLQSLSGDAIRATRPHGRARFPENNRSAGRRGYVEIVAHCHDRVGGLLFGAGA